jgi:hypothetical protein
MTEDELRKMKICWSWQCNIEEGWTQVGNKCVLLDPGQGITIDDAIRKLEWLRTETISRGAK